MAEVLSLDKDAGWRDPQLENQVVIPETGGERKGQQAISFVFKS